LFSYIGKNKLKNISIDALIRQDPKYFSLLLKQGACFIHLMRYQNGNLKDDYEISI
jgi:hypothetical protein